MWVRRTLLSLIALLLVIVVVLVGMQQWRSWRLDQSLGKASKTVAEASSAAFDVGYDPDEDDCPPKDPALAEVWSKALSNAALALAQLEAIHGPGSPHLHSLNRRLRSSLLVTSASKEACEFTVKRRHEESARKKRVARARAELVVRKRQETIARKKRIEEALVERRIREAKGLNKARMTVEAVVKGVALVVFSPDSSSSFCQGQEPAYSKYLVLERAAFAFLTYPPSATSQDEVAEWREKLLKAQNTKEDRRGACTESLQKRQ